MFKERYVTVQNNVHCLSKVLVLWQLVVIVTLLHIIQRSNCGTVRNKNNVMDILSRTRRQVSGKSCSNIHVEIIISPRINNSYHDLLVLYWESLVILPGDKVVLYDHDPNENLDNPLHTEFVDKNNNGWVVTGISERGNSSIPIVFRKICLGYWVAYIRGDSGEIAASACLSTEPRWMEETWHGISRLSLANMFIPGTHDSASYKESYSREIDTIVYKYTYTQEISVLSQLLWGARALDLRIGYYPESKDIWWCNHDFVRIRPLKKVIRDIKLFLNNTQEIIILDIHNFPVGFAGDAEGAHKKLLAYFESELKDYLAPASLGWAATLGDLKDSGKKVILAYNDRRGISEYTWAPVQHKWGNVQTQREFVNFFENLFQTQIKTAPWAAMVELTARAIDVFLNTLGGLRQMAAVVNPTLTSWFSGEWGRLCHIVHCDFIRGTGIVKAAIKWNLKRAGYHNCNVCHNSSTNSY